MTEVTMTVVDAVKAGILDVEGDGDVENGSAAGADDWFMPNDGRTVLVFHADAAGGDTITFAAVTNRYGRTETLAPVVSAGKVAILGPFNPVLWNDSSGAIVFALTNRNAADQLLAVRIANPT